MKEKKDSVEEKIDQALVRLAENTIRIGSLEKLLVQKGIISEQDLISVNNESVEKFFNLLNQEVQAQQELTIKSE